MKNIHESFNDNKDSVKESFNDNKDSIKESFKIGKNFKQKQFKYKPKTTIELRDLIRKLLDERGENPDFNDIDISELKSLTGVFSNIAGLKSVDISKWDMSNIEGVSFMFSGCNEFNCDLGYLDVSNVKNMSYMFQNCKKFEGKGLENWKTNNVITTYMMFGGCSEFNQDISSWNIENVKNGGFMFIGCKKLDIDLGNWNPASLDNAESMFAGCRKFDATKLRPWKQKLPKIFFDLINNRKNMFYNCKTKIIFRS